VGVTDDALTICGQEPVLAIFEPCPLMGAPNAIGTHLRTPAEYEHRVFTRVLRVEAARRTRRQLIETTEGNHTA
jgi:hypothetical protein